MSSIQLNVLRGDSETNKHYETYEVPFHEGMSVLDAVFWLRENVDPSIAVRYSCRSANACKECMALVDGKAGYMCSIRAVPGTKVKLEPLTARPWVKDLVTLLD